MANHSQQQQRMQQAQDRKVALAEAEVTQTQSTKHFAKRPHRKHGHVILWSPEAQVIVECRHSDLPQVSQERAGGWDTITRTTGAPVSTWTGTQAIKLKLQLLLDAWPNRGINPGLTEVRKLGRRAPGLDRPPRLQAIGRTPYQGRWWVVETMTITDQLYHRGKPARSTIELDLVEYVDPQIVVHEPSAKSSDRRKAHWYSWRKGDSLRGVAHSQLGDYGKGDLIRKANPKIKKWSGLKVGTKVRIPASSS